MRNRRINKVSNRSRRNTRKEETNEVPFKIIGAVVFALPGVVTFGVVRGGDARLVDADTHMIGHKNIGNDLSQNEIFYEAIEVVLELGGGLLEASVRRGQLSALDPEFLRMDDEFPIRYFAISLHCFRKSQDFYVE